MTRDAHLVLKEFRLGAGQEWMVAGEGWGFVHINDGAGYWREAPTVQELMKGDVLVVPCCSSGSLLASRIGELSVSFFEVHPDMLLGILSLAECQRLRCMTGNPQSLPRRYGSAEPFSRTFSTLCGSSKQDTLEVRMEMLRLFAEAFKEEFRTARGEDQSTADLSGRLRGTVESMSAAALGHLSLNELARRLCCSERHASRLFRSAYGVSLRDKQSELRLDRAKQILTQTNAKIVEVAMESGYQSLSQFNAMFKCRFGMTPSAWRQRAAARLKRNAA
jgi:AraC-like DNA-binding protein